MHEQESGGRFLASLLAEYGMSVNKFCRRSGLREHEVRLILRGLLTVPPRWRKSWGGRSTPPASGWSGRRCTSSECSAVIYKKARHARAKCLKKNTILSLHKRKRSPFRHTPRAVKSCHVTRSICDCM
jgi:hypothetical protein